MTKDLTVGHPLKIIFAFAMPVFLGYLFQQFYNLVDTIIVGQFLGVKALAAVGSTGSLNFLIIGFCMGLCLGFAIPVAQKFGGGGHERAAGYTAWLPLSTVVASATEAAIAELKRDEKHDSSPDTH